MIDTYTGKKLGNCPKCGDLLVTDPKYPIIAPHCARRDIAHTEHLWDKAADEVLPGWETKLGGRSEAVELLGCDRPWAPRRKGSSSCESGKRDYCTCDICW